MASVTCEKRNGRTRYRIEWRDGDKRRHKIRLSGELDNKKDADAIARKVTAIVSASISKRTLDNAVVQWLIEIGDERYVKLAESGLVEPRQTATLGDYLTNYIDARRNEVEARTIGDKGCSKTLCQSRSPDTSNEPSNFLLTPHASGSSKATPLLSLWQAHKPTTAG